MAIGDSLANPVKWLDNQSTLLDAIAGGAPRFFSMPLHKGVNYAFFVDAGVTFDAFLTLYDTLTNAQAVLATDDNSLYGTNPLIVSYIPPVSGIYYLGVSTLNFNGAFNVFSLPEPIYFRTKVSNNFNAFQNRFTKISNKIAFYNQMRSRSISNYFNSWDVHLTKVNNRFTVNAVSKASGGSGGSKFNIWSKDGYEVFANGILIGFLPEGVLTLTDIVLADDDYEIEVRPLGNFYREVGVRQVFKVNLDSGAMTATNLLPDIFDLASAVVKNKTYLGWTIKPLIGVVDANTKIGIWFNPASGISITGAPDVSFTPSNLLKFSYIFTQAVTKWAAVAFYNGSDRGDSSEIELIWSSTLPTVPPYQHISN